MFYLLSPRNLEAPEWKKSTFRDPVQVEATSEEDARIRASLHFTIGSKIEPGQPVRFPPWGNPSLVTARPISKLDSAVRTIRLNDKEE
jgi:hypothetical protein